MSDKYIIRNCPCYNNERFIGGFLDDKATFCTYYGKKCQGCTDCVMKQIVEKCRKEIRQSVLTERKLLASELLEGLDIQEVE